MKARHTTLFKHRASAYIWCLHSHTSPMSFMPAVSHCSPGSERYLGAWAATCKLLLLGRAIASCASPWRAGQLFGGIILTLASCVSVLTTQPFFPACEPQVQGTVVVTRYHIIALSPAAWHLQALFRWSHLWYGSAVLSTQAKAARGSWFFLFSSEDEVENTCKY